MQSRQQATTWTRTSLSTLRSFLEGDSLTNHESPIKNDAHLQVRSTYLLLSHGRDDGDEQVLSIVETALDLFAELSVGDTNVVLRDAILGHEVKETIVNIDLIKFRKHPRKRQRRAS